MGAPPRRGENPRNSPRSTDLSLSPKSFIAMTSASSFSRMLAVVEGGTTESCDALSCATTVTLSRETTLGGGASSRSSTPRDTSLEGVPFLRYLSEPLRGLRVWRAFTEPLVFVKCLVLSEGVVVGGVLVGVDFRLTLSVDNNFLLTLRAVCWTGLEGFGEAGDRDPKV